jgi:hypothetical protein
VDPIHEATVLAELAVQIGARLCHARSQRPGARIRWHGRRARSCTARQNSQQRRGEGRSRQSV